MRIGAPEISTENGLTTWSVEVRGLAGTPERLWFQVPEAHAGMLTDIADPALIGLLLPAMHSGESMIIDGVVTDELAHNLTHGYQHILEIVVPDLTQVAVEPRAALPASDPARGVGAGFSAGVDSYAVIAEHYLQPVPDDLRLTHLTFFNVGSHSSGEVGRRRFRARYDLLAPAADAIGLPFIAVDSNLDDFYSFTTYQQTYGPRNISAASLLQGALGRYYFAGSFAFRNSGVRRSTDTGFSEPISLPLLATRAFRPLSHGNEYSRVEKTLIVADAPLTYSSLNVCVSPTENGGNCSTCEKCLRTELTLDIAGRLSDYRSVFDLETYTTVRAGYLDHVAVRDDEFAREIREFAHRSGFELPQASLAAARIGAQRALRRARSRARRSFGSR